MDASEQGDTVTSRSIGGTGSPTGRTRRCPPLLLVPLAPRSMAPKPKRHSRQMTKVAGVGGKDCGSRPGRARSTTSHPKVARASIEKHEELEKGEGEGVACSGWGR